MDQEKIDDENVAGFTVNVCNDTVIKCHNETNGTFIMFNSTIIYRNGNGFILISYMSLEDLVKKIIYKKLAKLLPLIQLEIIAEHLMVLITIIQPNIYLLIQKKKKIPFLSLTY